MELVIVRHADAEPDSDGEDAARRLTPLGHQEARDAAAAIARAGLRPGVVFSSPFARALATATHVAAEFGLKVTPAAALESGRLDPAAVARLANDARADCVAVVGHMPDVAQLHSYFLGGPVDGYAKAEWRVVQFDGAASAGAGRDRAVSPPHRDSP